MKKTYFVEDYNNYYNLKFLKIIGMNENPIDEHIFINNQFDNENNINIVIDENYNNNNNNNINDEKYYRFNYLIKISYTILLVFPILLLFLFVTSIYSFILFIFSK